MASGSRLNVSLRDEFAALDGETVAVTVESLDGAPLVVEKSVYWDANGRHWSAGTNVTAVPLP